MSKPKLEVDLKRVVDRYWVEAYDEYCFLREKGYNVNSHVYKSLSRFQDLLDGHWNLLERKERDHAESSPS